MAAVRGATVAERAVARQQISRQRQIAFHAARVRSATTSHDQLIAACNYALAVGKDLNDDDRRNLARAVATLVDERSKP